MTHPTEIEQFQTGVQSAPEIMALVHGVAGEAELRETMAGTRIGDPLSAGLSLVAVAALWKLVNIGIDTLRRMGEDAALERRIGCIRELQAMGYERQAPFIVDRLIKEIRARPAGDPVLQKLAALYPTPE